MADSRSAGPGSTPADCVLLIVTGSSHSGKTTLIEELISRIDRRAVRVAIDEVIEEIDVGSVDRWEFGLDIAYQRAADATEELLGEGTHVLFESTFTYVPPDERPAEFHLPQLELLIAVANRVGASPVLVQLTASLGDVENRRRGSRRLDERIVRRTWELHSDRELPPVHTVVLDTSQVSTAQAAETVCEELPVKICDQYR